MESTNQINWCRKKVKLDCETVGRESELKQQKQAYLTLVWTWTQHEWIQDHAGTEKMNKGYLVVWLWRNRPQKFLITKKRSADGKYLNTLYNYVMEKAIAFNKNSKSEAKDYYVL